MTADDAVSIPVIAQLTADAAETKQRTAKRAAEILTSRGEGYVVPTARQRIAILIAFAQAEQVVYGKAFNIVRCPSHVNLDDPASIASGLNDVLICEIKSTNKATVKPDFRGYFFAITAGEMLTAQSLGARYRFLFVNTLTGIHLELTLQQIFARSRGIYPTWSISI